MPLVPLAVGTIAVAAALGGGPDEGLDVIELSSSAADFATVDQLVGASDLVVVARVAEATDGRQLTAPGDPDATVVTRLLVLDVSEVLAGAESGNVIVEEPAALGDGSPVVVDGVEPLEVGDEAIWFLVAGDGETMPYYAVTNRQGRYTVVGETLRPAAEDALSLELAALGRDGLVELVGAAT